jgi:hypothetical protein
MKMLAPQLVVVWWLHRPKLRLMESWITTGIKISCKNKRVLYDEVKNVTIQY